MKISIHCKSQILEKTLMAYLKEYITNDSNCDFIIVDNLDNNFRKDICLIDFSKHTNVKRPFDKKSLLKDLDSFIKNKKEIGNKSSTDYMDSINNDKIKEELENIIRDFTNKIYLLITNNR